MAINQTSFNQLPVNNNVVIDPRESNGQLSPNYRPPTYGGSKVNLNNQGAIDTSNPTTPVSSQNTTPDYTKHADETIDQYNARVQQYYTELAAPNGNTSTPTTPTTPTSGATPPTNTGMYNAQGQMVDSKGNVVQSPKTISDVQANLDKNQAELDAEAARTKTTLDGYINGTIPLTPGEQAQVDSLKQSYQTFIDQQKLTNIGASGTANIRGYQKGSAEYDPMFQTKTIGAVVQAGQQKVLNLQTEEAGAVAKLTQAFRDNDMAAVKNAWDMYSKASQQRQDAFQKSIDDTNSAIKYANTQAEQAKQDAYKQIQDQIVNQMNQEKFDYQKTQDALDQSYKNKQLDEKTYMDAQDLLIKKQTLALSQGTSTLSNVNLPQVTMTAGNTPNIKDQTAFLAQFPQDLQTSIKAIANYDQSPNSFPTRNYKGVGSVTQSQILSWVKQFDPTYSESQYANRQAYIKNVQSGQIGQGILAANKSINHLIAFNDAIAKIKNGGISSVLNQAGNSIVQPFAPALQQNVKTAQTEANGLKDELAKFFKGTGASDVKSIDDWSKSLNVNATPGDQRGVMQGAINLLAGQLDVLNQQYQQTMGKAPGNTFIQPQTIQKLSQLKNQGFNVDIPGVFYSDKNAYLKNGGSIGALNQARQTLISANDPNNPPTPENILELAQLQ